MQSSIAFFPHMYVYGGVVRVQSHSHTNFVPTTNSVPKTITPKPNHFTSTQIKSTYRITLRCNSQPQPLPNLFASKSPRVSGSNVAPLRCGISSNEYSANEGRSVGEWLVLAGEVLSTGFPLWVTIASVLGLMKPSYFNWVTPKLSIMGLNIIMLGMGMTLTLDDLRGVLAMPKEVLSGFLIQYSVMPLSGFLISKLLNLPSHSAAGLILLGCCPGGMNFNFVVSIFSPLCTYILNSLCLVAGTASNIITYLARANVALSVIMTTASTISAMIMTPLLTAKLAGKYVAVDAPGLLISTLQVVLVPVLAGAFLNQFFQPIVKFVSPLMPPIAVITVAILCGNAIGQSSSAILASGGQVILATFLLQASGFFFGYLFARLLRLDVSSSRTISSQVGMKNCVLQIVLATKHFGDPLSAVPGALAIVNQSIIGSILAGIWRRIVPV
ncbi:putative sodium/metabolite cotransporter BASS1, chloroplastic [Glycine soja]